MQSSVGVSPYEVTGVLHQTLSELERVKRQLQQPFSTKETIAASISRLEDGLRRQAQDIVYSALTAEPAPASPPQPTVGYKPKALPQLPHYSLNRTSLQHMTHPTTDQARQYLEDRFGIPTPAKALLPSERSLHPGSGPGTLAKGKTLLATPGVVLPKPYRDDPHGLPPPELTDLDLDKGLLHLVNRRLLPHKADLTPALCSQTGPYRAGGAPLYPYYDQFARPPPTSALEDALQARADYKLDLLTPVLPPQEAQGAGLAEPAGLRPLSGIARRKAALHVTSFGTEVAPGVTLDALLQQQQQQQQQEQQEAGASPLAGAGGVPHASMRTFDVLMDAFSLHEFMIRKGEAIRETPEFESYRRTFEGVWPTLEALLRHLEAICVQYGVPLAVVNGKSLADLALQVTQSGYQPQMEDLLVCLSNIQEVAGVLKQPGRRFHGPGGADAAAALIQAHFRGHLARRRYSRRGQASAAIQNAWRNSRLRQQLRSKLRIARAERDMRFMELQAQLQDQWPLMQRNAHVVIHVPNLMPSPAAEADGAAAADGGAAASAVHARPEPHVLNALLLREAAQLARLCDLSEPLLDVILVLGSPPDPDVVSYWNKILEVGGVQEPATRYRIIVPENHSRLPTHMTITAKLLASPRAMKRLHVAVQGRLAYMVPGNVHDGEVELAVQLGVPLLGPSPVTFRAFSRKSAARELFMSVGANVAPGCTVRPRAARLAAARGHGHGHDGSTHNGCGGGAASSRSALLVRDSMTSPLRPNTEFAFMEDGSIAVLDPEDDPATASSLTPRTHTHTVREEQGLLMQLAEAMIRNPAAPKWLLKIDDQSMGLGHAFFDTHTVKGAADVLARAEALAAAAAPGFAASEAQAALRRELGIGPSTTQATTSALSEEQQVELFRLYELLFRQLPKRLQLACRESYPSYRDYMAAFAERGGVVEACPHMAVGSPCANLFLDPSGAVTVLSTHERIFCYPFRAVGTTFPQASVPARALHDAAVAIGGAAHDAGLVGHVAVEFVTLAERDGSLRLWPVDLRPGLTPTLLSFQLFDFLTAGTFNALAGTYSVELDPIMDDEDEGDDDAAGDDAAGDGASVLSSEPSRDPTAAAAATSGDDSPHRPKAAALLPDPTQEGPPGHSGRGSLPPVVSLRHYFAIEQLTHPAVKSTPCSKFFYQCWQNGFHFDVDNRTGVIFNLSDRYLTSGALGMVCVSLTQNGTYGQMQKVLSFIAGQELDAAIRSAWSRTPDMTLYNDVQSLVQYMAETSKEQEQQGGAGGRGARAGALAVR